MASSGENNSSYLTRNESQLNVPNEHSRIPLQGFENPTSQETKGDTEGVKVADPISPPSQETKGETEDVTMVDPISYKFPENSDIQPTITAENQSTLMILSSMPKRATGGSSKVLDTSDAITVHLEQCCIDYIKRSDKKRSRDDYMSRRTKKKSTLTWNERLEGWAVQLRQRSNGRIDKFYLHKNYCTLRSLVDVENYIVYGVHPRRAQRSEEETSKGASLRSLQPMAGSAQAGSSKRKITNERSEASGTSPEQPPSSQYASNKEYVEAFLAAAYNNLLNRDNSPKDNCFVPSKTCNEDIKKTIKELFTVGNSYVP